MVGNNLEIVGPVLKSSKIILHLRLSLEVIRKSLTIFGSCHEIFSNLQRLSEIFGDFQKSSEIFGNLQKLLENLQKFRFYGDVKSHTFYWKKVGRYTIYYPWDKIEGIFMVKSAGEVGWQEKGWVLHRHVFDLEIIGWYCSSFMFSLSQYQFELDAVSCLCFPVCVALRMIRSCKEYQMLKAWNWGTWTDPCRPN